MPEYIFDTTVLSNLAAVGRLDLLEKRYGQVTLTTVEVSDELRRGLQAGYGYLGDVLQFFDDPTQAPDDLCIAGP
jgi:predicted nucleic acid-binding protein